MTGAIWRGVTLDCADLDPMVAFYEAVLGWRTIDHDPSGWAQLAGDADVHLNIQAEPGYVAPTWPEAAGAQQKMMHFEIQVDDLPAAIERAVGAGGRIADFQPPDRDQDRIRIVLDPAGHPLCFFLAGE